MKAYGKLFYFAVVIIFFTVTAPAHSQTKLEFFTQQKRNPNIKHVHLMHIDGVRPDLFKQMLKAGQLPHFQFLLKRGRISFNTSTTDKSETMKVIQSYLTSKLDTTVVGWWQFDRTTFQFRNFWLDPVEVMNYALGLEFPVVPTLHDYFAANNKNQLAGFSLHRRGVPFDKYGRAYAEGAMAVKEHTYFNQAAATMRSLQDLLKKETQRIEQSNGSIDELPVFTTSLLAPVDEFGHLEGVYKSCSFFDFSYSCFIKRKPYNYFFEELEHDTEATVFIKSCGGERKILGRPLPAHFAVYYPEDDRICIKLPKLTELTKSENGDQINIKKRYAHRDYALGLILVDIQLGKLINTLRSIDFSTGKPRYLENINRGIVEYAKKGRRENTLFEDTLFVLFGDHGMADTPKEISGAAKDSDSLSFIEILNQNLGLKSAKKGQPLKDFIPADKEQIFLGVDNTLLPLELSMPQKFVNEPYWSLSPAEKMVMENKIIAAEEFSQNFIELVLSAEGHMVDNLKDSIMKRFWWLLFLRKFIVEPRIDAALEEGKIQITDLITYLYLKGDPEYRLSERRALKNFYDQHIKLVYGGGARNNAELFLPRSVIKEGKRTLAWDGRPSYDQILNYRPGSGKTLLQALQANPAADLIFIRQNNAQIKGGHPRKEPIKITVLNSRGDKGVITVKRDGKTLELLFSYEVSPGYKDPLGYNSDRPRNRTNLAAFATYNEWNDLSVEKEHYYHNVVAGMGSYLYSNNPSIGDITVTHRQNWNFGSNLGGHGGVHREEKLTVLMVSGPGISPSATLMAQQRYETDDSGRVLPSRGKSYPTILDIAPTIYQWLGVTDKDLQEFAQNDFQPYLEEWTGQQRDQILAHLNSLEDEVERIGIGRPTFEKIKEHLEQLLRFIPDKPPDIPEENLQRYRMDGQPVIYAE